MPDAAVDEEDDDVGLLGGEQRLIADRRLEVVDRAGLDAAGVDEHELDAVPVRAVIAAVARDAARLVNDGLGRLGDTVHERGLADVRSADHGDDGKCHDACSLFELPSEALRAGIRECRKRFDQPAGV